MTVRPRVASVLSRRFLNTILTVIPARRELHLSFGMENTKRNLGSRFRGNDEKSQGCANEFLGEHTSGLALLRRVELSVWEPAELFNRPPRRVSAALHTGDRWLENARAA